MRAREKSADAVVVKTSVETREERRAEETKQGEIAESLRRRGRAGHRNEPGVTTTVATRIGAGEADGWRPDCQSRAVPESAHGRGEGNDERRREPAARDGSHRWRPRT